MPGLAFPYPLLYDGCHMTTLTARQKAILDFIERAINKRGYPPTLREIAGHFGMVGTRGAQKHLAAIEKKGYLRKGSGARALELLGRGPSRSVPILGKVAAGKPILAQENLLGSLMVDSSIARWKDLFLLKVQGASMKGAGILEGDFVLVRPQADADSGEIVVAMVDGEVTVKRLVRKRGMLILMPGNPDFEPIVITEKADSFRILGKVVTLIRPEV